jgi:hypothetical protein
MTSLIYFTVCAVQDSDNLLWIVAKLSSEYHSCEDTFTYPQRFFAKRDQLVGIAMCAMHDRAPKFCPNKARPASMTSRGVLECPITTREAAAVDLSLRLNALAVCAVFVFVGAILLGAF